MQLTNTLRDIDEDAGIGRLYLPRDFLVQQGITSDDPHAVLAHPALRGACAAVAALAAEHFERADKIMAASPRAMVRAPRIMGEAYQAHFARPARARLGGAARAGQARQAAVRANSAAQLRRMTGHTVHVIGAGLAGLSAATRLAQAGTHVVLHEAGAQAGGRCRSYVDTVLNMPIDNGNHVILSGNRSALSYLQTIGASGRLRGPSAADFHFVDLASRERWKLRLGDGFFPWWIFDDSRRVPNTRMRDYLVLARLMVAARPQDASAK